MLALGAVTLVPSAMAAAKKPAAKPAAKAAPKGKAPAKKEKLTWDSATAIGGKIGTLGLGIELSKPINDN